jgi:hypothetical protein
MSRESRAVVVGIAVALWAWQEPVSAYLDPGASNTLLQGLVAVISATLTTIALYWRATKNFVRRVLRRNSDPELE